MPPSTSNVPAAGFVTWAVSISWVRDVPTSQHAGSLPVEFGQRLDLGSLS